MRFLEDILNPKQRKIAYAVFGLIGILIGATFAGFAAAAATIPVWLKVTAGVYTFLGGAFGATAAANVAPQKL